MADFRIKGGLSLGPYGTVGGTSGQHLLSVDDTTPDVSLGSFFLTQNTGATTITYLDGVLSGGLNGVEEGKVVVIRFGDNLTTVANAGRMFLQGTGAAMTTGQTLSLIHFNSAWYEIARSELGRESVKTVTLAAGSAAINVAGVRTLIVTPSGGAVTVLGLSGGVIGQYVTILKNAVSAGTGVNLLGQANFHLASTALLVMDGSAAYSFVCDNGTRFRELAGPSVP